MSASASVHATLESVGFVQLALLFATLIAYGVALSEAFSARARGGAALAALVAAAAFATATPGFADGVVLLALAIALVGAFAGATWLLAGLLGLDARDRRRMAETREPLANSKPTEVAPALRPSRAAPHLS